MTSRALPELPSGAAGVPHAGMVPVVWPTGQRGEHLVEHGYTSGTERDHLRVAPETAAYAIRAFTQPGATVIDPDCGAGTVLVEALHCGRHAVGVARGRRWWTLARANLTAAKRQGAVTDGMVLPTSRAGDLTASADLVLTAWRPAADTTTPSDASDGTRPGSVEWLAGMLTWSRSLLRPGGHLVVVARPQRRHGYLLDGPGHIQRAARAARLVPAARCIALQVPLRESELVLRPSLAQRRAVARCERLTGHPIGVTAHHDVLVFRAPGTAAQAAAAAVPAPSRIPPRLRERADAGLRELVGGAA
ncbi:TRM11 family methyltransferase [Streptomyces specialis]|uniref:hypothetical protein n=1 Tax=Streptomyces specialis TaxID=498367 RepID=UPI00073E5384|nr:hypothetical protein [Streptomyces specialis]